MSIILRNVIRFLPNLTADVPGWVDLADRWQEALLGALESGSAEEARAVSVAHATESGELWIRYGAAQGYFGNAADPPAAESEPYAASSGDTEPVVGVRS